MSGDSVRAVRNNNPGNIERGKAKWQGLMQAEEMSPEQAAEGRFCVFRSPRYGFRAMAATIITYQDKRQAADGSRIDTIREVIERWAPAFENNVIAYVRSVDKDHPKTSSDELDFHRYEDLAPLVKAMSKHECGGWFFKDADLREGLRLAGVEPPLQPIHEDRVVQASTVGGPIIGGGVLSELFGDDNSSILDFYHQASYYWPKIALLCAVGIGGYFLWRHIRNRRRGIV